MIAQPTFFPWIGYFDMIEQVDLYVILDDVEFDYQSWQHRNNFKTSKGLEYFTIPILEGKKKKLIKDVTIKDPSFAIKKFKKFIFTNYSKSNYFRNFQNDFYSLLDKISSEKNLLLFNLEIIKWVLKIMKIKTSYKLSSEMNIHKKKELKILEICKNLDATEYLSTIGSKDYLSKSEEIFFKQNITINYHNYFHPSYNQLFKPFKKFACILDLLFNEGDKSLEIIKSGRIKN